MKSTGHVLEPCRERVTVYMLDSEHYATFVTNSFHSVFFEANSCGFLHFVKPNVSRFRCTK